GAVRLVSESGVAAGVRRIEAVTGRRAHALLREREAALTAIAARLKVNTLTGDALTKKVDDLLAERKKLERRVEEALAGGGAGGGDLLAGAASVGTARLLTKEITVPTMKELQALGDAVRAALGRGIGLLLGTFEDEKQGLVVVVTDDLVGRGITAGGLVKTLAAETGIKGGGKPHMAQAGVAAEQREAVRSTAQRVARGALGGGA
ncbi:MAG: DHHA1 domain-containing protein, partial [Gemmatimonadota bacterium]